MTYDDLFSNIVAIINDLTQPDKIVSTVFFLAIILGVSAIPFIGLPIAIIIFVITIRSLLN